MNSQSSEVHINGKYSDAAQTVDDYIIIERVIHNLNLNHDEESILEPYLNVYLKDSCAPEHESPHNTISCPRTTRGEQQHTPDTCTSQSPSLNSNTSIADKVDDDSVVFADRDSGVVFSSGLIRASGDRVTVQEFCCTARGLAPTLHLVIPSPSAAPTRTKEQQASPLPSSLEEEKDGACPSSLPTFALTLPSPITAPHSPIHPPTPPPKPFTRASYYAEVARAPSSTRIPYLPQYCSHTLRPFIPPTNCPLCAIQLLACETWWNSRNPDPYAHPPLPPSSKKHGGLTSAAGGGWSRSRSKSIMMLCAPQVLPADCTPTTRAIFYALGLPLGKLDESCVDLDVVDAIMFIPSCLPRRHRGNKKARGSSSRIQALLRRARHFFSTPARHIHLR